MDGTCDRWSTNEGDDPKPSLSDHILLHPLVSCLWHVRYEDWPRLPDVYLHLRASGVTSPADSAWRRMQLTSPPVWSVHCFDRGLSLQVRNERGVTMGQLSEEIQRYAECGKWDTAYQGFKIGGSHFWDNAVAVELSERKKSHATGAAVVPKGNRMICDERG